MGISSGWNFNFDRKSNVVTLDLKTINEIFPKANNWAETSENIFLVLSGNDTTGTAVLVTENPGYGGKVPLLIGLKEDTIIKIQLLANNETTEFMEYIKEDKLLARWEGMRINKVSGTEVDAVSGATESSNAIIRGVRQGAAQYLNEEQSNLKKDFASISKDLLFLFVIMLSIVMSYVQSMKKFRNPWCSTIRANSRRRISLAGFPSSTRITRAAFNMAIRSPVGRPCPDTSATTTTNR